MTSCALRYISVHRNPVRDSKAAYRSDSWPSLSSSVHATLSPAVLNTGTWVAPWLPEVSSFGLERPWISTR